MCYASPLRRARAPTLTRDVTADVPTVDLMGGAHNPHTNHCTLPTSLRHVCVYRLFKDLLPDMLAEFNASNPRRCSLSELPFCACANAPTKYHTFPPPPPMTFAESYHAFPAYAEGEPIVGGADGVFDAEQGQASALAKRLTNVHTLDLAVILHSNQTIVHLHTLAHTLSHKATPVPILLSTLYSCDRATARCSARAITTSSRRARATAPR